MAATTPNSPETGRPPLPPLTAADLPPGYRCIAVAPPPRPAGVPAQSETAVRWLAPRGAPPADPLAVDVSLARFARQAEAMRALTGGPALPDELAVRPLFAPRIGDDSVAVRADTTAAGDHYVLYRVDLRVGGRLATVAAVWRWPAGSPVWVYERARRIAHRLAAADRGHPIDMR
jgi:hypothetical protein